MLQCYFMDHWKKWKLVGMVIRLLLKFKKNSLDLLKKSNWSKNQSKSKCRNPRNPSRKEWKRKPMLLNLAQSSHFSKEASKKSLRWRKPLNLKYLWNNTLKHWVVWRERAQRKKMKLRSYPVRRNYNRSKNLYRSD